MNAASVALCDFFISVSQWPVASIASASAGSGTLDDTEVSSRKSTRNFMRITSRSELVDWCTERATKVEGTRDRRTLRHVTRRDGEFTDWDAVCEAVRRVARFSFETGSVLRHYS